MPLTGNDIVDLKHPMNVRKSTDLRFLKKILTDTEISLVKESDTGCRFVGWYCKEAAYG